MYCAGESDLADSLRSSLSLHPWDVVSMLAGCQDYGLVVGLRIGVTVLSSRASLAPKECGVYRFGDPPPTRIGAPNLDPSAGPSLGSPCVQE